MNPSLAAQLLPMPKQRDPLISTTFKVEDHCIFLTAIGDSTSFVLAKIDHIAPSGLLELSQSCWAWFDIGAANFLPVPGLIAERSKALHTIALRGTRKVVAYPSYTPYPIKFLQEEKFRSLHRSFHAFDVQAFYNDAVECFSDVPSLNVRENRIYSDPDFLQEAAGWEQRWELLTVPQSARRPR